MPINNGIINQKGTPAFYSDIFANRPAFGYAGRVFISTDTGAIYEDTGSAWTLIADAGAGTTGTLQQVTTNGNTTTLGIVVDGISINNGAGTGTFNTAIGSTDSLALNTTGANNIAVGYTTLSANTTGSTNTAVGVNSLNANTTGSNNTTLGSRALKENTTASFNTAIGSSSLQNNTTGSNNTALGYLSLNANTTGANNVAIGSIALLGNTTGDGNVAVGYLSSATNTTGVNNSSLGLSSLRLNTTGANNTAIGSVALQNNTIADNNTAVGYSALANNTGANNTAVGVSALGGNTTGIENTAFGVGTLNASTTGQFNSGFGRSSLNANTTGNYNTAIGGQALANISTGSQNIGIGYNCGLGITTGSFNTIIGTNVTGLSATLSNNIILADGAGNVRLFSDANGLIGINQAVGSTIGGQLDIHSTQTYALVLNGLSTSNAYTAFSNANVGKWRIGNTYNAGANSFDIFNLGTSSTALSFNSTTNAATFSSSVSVKSPSTSSNLFTANYSNNNQMLQLFEFASGVDAELNLRNSGGTAINRLSTNGYSFINGGNVLIGTTTDAGYKLEINGGDARITSSGDPRLVINSTATNGKNWSLISDSSGNLSIGRTGVANYVFFVDGGVVRILDLAGTGSRAVIADASGNLSAPVSDISVKENINTIGYGLNEILKMNPVWFNYNDEYKNYGEGRQNGNIAQEMEAIIPEAVFTTPSTGKMGINYDQLHAVYIKAIQELNEKLIRNNIN